MAAIQTLGELRRSNHRARPVKQEIRDNLVRKLQAGETLFPGIIGLRRDGHPATRECDPLAS